MVASNMIRTAGTTLQRSRQMKKPVIRNYGLGPEAKIQQELIKFLETRKWFVKVLHGNAFQQGMPDLFCCQRAYGYRFIECKQPVKYMFTSAQVDTFPAMNNAGVGIWVVTEASEREYEKLFQRPNWWAYFDENHIRLKKEKGKEPPEQKGPEAEIQRRIIARLEKEGWFCKALHGDLYQFGMPDIFACKKGCGWRFIEVKNPVSYRFTGAQYETFPRLQAEGVGVWILTSEEQLALLDKPPNWYHFLDGAS